MRRSQNANAAFGAIAIALVGAIAIIGTPVAAAVSGASGLSEQRLEKSDATLKIAESTTQTATQKKKKKKKKTRYPAGKGS